VQALREPFFDEDLRGDLVGVGIAAGLEITCREQVILAHDHHGVGRANLAHFVLLLIQVVHFLVIFHAHLVDGGDVGSVIQVGFHAPIFHHQRFDFLVVQNGAQATAGSLFEAAHLTARVVEREIDHAHVAVFRAATGAGNRDIDHVVFVFCVLPGEFFRQQVGVFGVLRSVLDLDAPVISVNKDQDLLFRLALQLESVPAREFEQGSKVTAHIAVNRDTGEGGDGAEQGLACAGILGDAAQGADTHDNFIFR